MRRCFSFATCVAFFWCSSATHAQVQPSVFNLLQNARNRITISKNDPFGPPRKAADEVALNLARQALALPFDTLRQPSITSSTLSDYSRDITEEFVFESQIKSEYKDWVGAMNSRLDALELVVKIEAISEWYSDAAYRSSLETIIIKNIYDIAIHLNGESSQIIAARLDAIESQRPIYLDLLKSSKAKDLRYIEEISQKPDWKNFLVQDSSYTMTSPFDGERLVYGFTIQELDDVTPKMLQNQVSQLWDMMIEREQQGYGVKCPTLGFKPHPAMAVLFSYPGESYASESVIARTQTLLLSAALKLKTIHQKTGSYPPTFKTPPDPFAGGKPLIYWTIGKTYRLYSVGSDGVDDGRTTPLSRFQARWSGDVIPPLLEPETDNGMN